MDNHTSSWEWCKQRSEYHFNNSVHDQAGEWVHHVGRFVGSWQHEIDQAIEQTIVQTRKYARRQISWFKRDPLIQWFDAQEDELLEKVNRII